VRFRPILIYLPVIVLRVGSGANAFLISYLAPGTHVEVGYVLASYSYIEALTALWAGYMADRLGRKLVLNVGYLIMMILTVMIYLSFSSHMSPHVVAVLNGGMGVGAAFILVSSLTMITDMTEGGYRGVGMGVFDSLNLVGFSLGYLVGSILYEVFRGPLAFIPLLAVSITTYLFVIMYVVETRPMHGHIHVNPLRGLTLRVISVLPIWFAITTILGMVIYAGRVLGNVPGVRPIEVGALVVGGTLVIGLGSVFFGYLSDRLGRLRILTLGVLGVILALINLAIMLSLNVEPTKAILVSAPLFLLASAIAPSILALAGDESSRITRGSSMGIYSLALGIGMGLGNVVSGYAYSILGLRGMVMAALAVFIAGLAMYAVLRLMIRIRMHEAATR